MTERKKQILGKAQELFRQRGYAASSIRDLANVVGVEPASLYSHIKGKEELLDSICFDLAGRFLVTIAEVNDIYFNAEQRLRMAIENHVKILTENVDAAIVFERDWRYLNEERKMEFIALRDQYEDGFRNIVQGGIDEGVFKAVDLKFATLTILSSLNWIVEWYKADGKLSSKDIADRLSNFVMGGLKKEIPPTY